MTRGEVSGLLKVLHYCDQLSMSRDILVVKKLSFESDSTDLQKAIMDNVWILERFNGSVFNGKKAQEEGKI